MFSEKKQIRKLLKLPHYSNINLNTSPKHTQNAAFFQNVFNLELETKLLNPLRNCSLFN